MKRNIRYQLRLFLTALACIWVVVLGFAWLKYHIEKESRREMLQQRVRLAVGNIIDAHEKGRELKPYMDFVDRYFANSDLCDISITVYDKVTGEATYTIGDLRTCVPSEDDLTHAENETYVDGSEVKRLTDITIGPNKEKIFFFSSRTSPDGQIEVRTYLPYTPEVHRALRIRTEFWIMILGVGVVGSVLAFFITKHQAKNVALLHDFARRAAADRDFIPMGDFPSDEIGDISRQIVAIYNSRMQANVRREREHIIALKATDEKNLMKRTLTNNISHELKTPIGIIRGYIDMIISQPDMPEEDRIHFLQKTQQNVERIVGMLADLSTMTRLEEGSKNITVKSINFHDFIFTLEEDVRGSGLTGDMDFRYNLPLDCMVRGNEGLLTSAITNLVKNARAYSQGTVMGIDLLGRNENFYTFSFYDNGVGVGEEHLQHIFDRFYRIDVGRSRKSGGTGLGLPIVKSSINSMGGSISVRNRKGGGLEFIFTLPRVKQQRPASGSAGSPESNNA